MRRGLLGACRERCRARCQRCCGLVAGITPHGFGARGEVGHAARCLAQDLLSRCSGLLGGTPRGYRRRLGSIADAWRTHRDRRGPRRGRRHCRRAQQGSTTSASWVDRAGRQMRRQKCAVPDHERHAGPPYARRRGKAPYERRRRWPARPAHHHGRGQRLTPRARGYRSGGIAAGLPRSSSGEDTTWIRSSTNHDWGCG